jgi:hypothetical protein
MTIPCGDRLGPKTPVGRVLDPWGEQTIAAVLLVDAV